MLFDHSKDAHFVFDENELEPRKIGHHLHDRELGRAGVAEEMRDAFVDEELEERGAAVAYGHVEEAVS